ALIDVYGSVNAPARFEAVGCQAFRGIVQAAGPDPVRYQRDRLLRFHCYLTSRALVISLRPLFGFDLIGEGSALSLMSGKEFSAEEGPGGVLFGRHLFAVDFGFHIGVRSQKLTEQQTHLLAVPTVELDPSRVH